MGNKDYIYILAAVFAAVLFAGCANMRTGGNGTSAMADGQSAVDASGSTDTFVSEDTGLTDTVSSDTFDADGPDPDVPLYEAEAYGPKGIPEDEPFLLNSEGAEEGSYAEEYENQVSAVMKYGTISAVNDDKTSITVTVSGSYTNDNGATTSYMEDIIFHIPEGTPMLDSGTGLPLSAYELKEGDYVYAWAGDTMTLSLPAQMVLEALAVNPSADSAAPLYAVVKETEWNKDDGILYITGRDESIWEASEEGTEVLPFKTRQIVTLNDIGEGSRLFIYEGYNDLDEGALLTAYSLASGSGTSVEDAVYGTLLYVPAYKIIVIE